jgi:hypothetical protein
VTRATVAATRSPGPDGEAPCVTEVTTVHGLSLLLRRLRRRDARRRGGPALTYRDLAAETGWSRGIIGEYFTGDVLPPTDRFGILVGLLGVTAAERVMLATARDRVEDRRCGTRPVSAGPAPSPF